MALFLTGLGKERECIWALGERGVKRGAALSAAGTSSAVANRFSICRGVEPPTASGLCRLMTGCSAAPFRARCIRNAGPAISVPPSSPRSWRKRAWTSLGSVDPPGLFTRKTRWRSFYQGVYCMLAHR